MVIEDTSKIAPRDELYNVPLQSWTRRAVAFVIVSGTQFTAGFSSGDCCGCPINLSNEPQDYLGLFTGDCRHCSDPGFVLLFEMGLLSSFGAVELTL